MKLAFLFATALIVAVLVYSTWRHRLRHAIDAMANALGLRRLPGETDAELRERCARALAIVHTHNREGIESLVRDCLWGHGYRRARVVVDSPSPGLIRARVESPAVPVGVLAVVQREVQEMVPMSTILEVR